MKKKEFVKWFSIIFPFVFIGIVVFLYFLNETGKYDESQLTLIMAVDVLIGCVIEIGMLMWLGKLSGTVAPEDYDKSLVKENMVVDEYSKKLNKDNPDGIDVKLLDDGYFIFVGKFNLGDLGWCQGDKIRIYFDGEDIERLDLSNEQAIEKVKKFIYNMKSKIDSNKAYLKNYFLTMAIETYMESENPFWEDYMRKGFKTKDYEEIGMDEILTEKDQEKIEKALEKFDEFGITKKISFDAENFIRDKFKWFDIDAFLKSIKIESISFNMINSETMTVQISDEHSTVFCGAYDEFDENMTPNDWHNF